MSERLTSPRVAAVNGWATGDWCGTANGQEELKQPPLRYNGGLMILFLLVILASCLVLVLLMVSILIRRYLLVVTVESESMAPTLQPGDRILAVRHWPAASLRKGQIVLVWSSRTASTGPTLFEARPYIKRIVALGEETLTMSSADGVEPGHPQPDDTTGQQRQQIWHIPKGHIFVRGDNRQNSLDSLIWGPISIENVLGVFLMKLPRKSSSPPLSEPLPFHEIPPIGLPAGQDAPPFTAQTLNGETVTLTTYSGRAVVFLFFAPSHHCRQALSTCAILAPKAKAAGVNIVCVSSTGLEPTRPFVKELHLSLPVLVAPRALDPFLLDYNIAGTPAYCFINEQGKVRSAGSLSSLIRSELKELAASWVRQKMIVPDELY